MKVSDRKNKKIVVSASRRTDIPAFYMDDFMKSAQRGFFRVTNPFNRKESIVEFSPDRVHTVVFWSKNYGKFIEGGYGERLMEAGYNLFFNFTINTCDLLLEPAVPPVGVRLEQLEALCNLTSPASVFWRFDPICCFIRADGSTGNNLGDFLKIADAASGLGIATCVTSFLDLYAKVKKRASSVPGFSFVDPPMEKKVEILLKMARRLKERNMDLSVCCEKPILEALPPDSGVTASSCVPNRLLAKLYGPNLSMAKDCGQRIEQGCGCLISVDIGTYHLQPCRHNCLFCYANPSSDAELRKGG